MVSTRHASMSATGAIGSAAPPNAAIGQSSGGSSTKSWVSSAVMLARSYRDFEAYDAAVVQLRDYVERLLADGAVARRAHGRTA